MGASIERKVLMEPVKQHPLLLATAVVIGVGFLGGLIWGGLFVFFWVLISFLVWYMLGFSILPILLVKRANPIVATRAQEAMLAFIGSQPKYLDTRCTLTRSMKGLTGTGIALTDQYLYVLDDGEIGKIPFDQIRGWTWKIQGYTQLRGSDTATSINAGVETMANRSRAHVDSGLFVNVKNVDKPSWQFMTTDKKLLQRWSEIFTQKFCDARASN